MGTYLPGARMLDWVVWSGAGFLLSQGIPLGFYPAHVNVGLPVHCLSTPLCVSMPPRASAPPTLLDECGFFKYLVVRLPYSSIF